MQTSLRVVSFDVQNLHNGFGTGTFTMHPRDVKNLRHVWPHMTSLWVTYYEEFVWAGMITGLSLQNGALSLGCNVIEDYLNRRSIREDFYFPFEEQNIIGRELVEYVRRNFGIPLYGAAIESNYGRDRTYAGVSRLNVGEQIVALSQVRNGFEWRTTGERVDGRWEATMTFADKWGEDLDVTLVSDVDAPDYGLEINTDAHATVVDSTSGQDESTLIGSAYDFPYPTGDSAYVEFDTVQSFQDVKKESTLQQQSEGYLSLNREPSITPRMVLTGREAMTGTGIHLGDTVEARMCISGFRYEGPSRVIGETWHAAPDTASSRELMLTPNNSPSQTMLDKKPCTNCPDC